ncbi:DEAD/DEAH box helicase [Beggiatoa leptomitoformis]|uniref:ATP-dependent RNA helicase RhlB n=1 Tax=Beggiatoa leptomitoformis TaxID=288004 RepID=A0A2N9YCP9_9GAMM|nr:DEAD/DEAH box helicase [Beggiatoa leptomitoformis]ALG66492.1 DEAD/DEAH box helicase [Beggiatoa leptomitoformis]AUI68216.2 DEAD/DEAH box helicase [Beggiatoa leptomitoformis]
MSTETYLTDIAFDSLALSPALLQGLADAGFKHCTPIQASTLPLALSGQDVAGQAQTGTGKTIAFLLAVLAHLLKNPPSERRQANQPRALILAPTRELAIQIAKDCTLLSEHLTLKSLAVYGGEGYHQQRNQLVTGIDVLIGTPGRIIDYYKQHVFNLKAVQAVVLDEADRMFDLGFIKDLRFLLRQLPKPSTRLNLMFSATLSWRVQELAYESLNNPQFVKIDSEAVIADKMIEHLYHVGSEEKLSLLLGILKREQLPPQQSEIPTVFRILIFINTKRTAEKICQTLGNEGYAVALMSGDVVQKRRMQLLQQFALGKIAIMVATDVAARGLHIPAVTHVINYDLPQDAEDYVHRIGRTARAGASGQAISFGCEEYVYSLSDIEEYIGHKIPVLPVEDNLLIKPAPLPKFATPTPQKQQRRPAPPKKSLPPATTSTSTMPTADGSDKPKKRNRLFRNPKKAVTPTSTTG